MDNYKYQKYKRKYLRQKQSINTNYWIGPYSVLVPSKISYVVASDGCNTLYQTGEQTERGCLGIIMNEEIYKKKYAIYNPNHKLWFYKES